MMTLQTPFSYERLNPFPLDASAVFNSFAEFQAYLTGVTGVTVYAGQICAVRNGTNEPDLYRINEDRSYSPLGEGGAASLPLGVPGTYIRGTHFDIAGVTLQQFLDANINGRVFFGGVTIDNGTVARTTPVAFRNLYMQGQTLNIKSDRQFASMLTLSGINGGVGISGSWGATNFATTLSAQNITGTLILNGDSTAIQFGAIDCFNCPDVRLDCGWDKEMRVTTRLRLLRSAAFLQGQGTARHTFTATDLWAGSRLEIADTLRSTAVALGSGMGATEYQGFVLDYRLPNRSLETFARRGASTGTGAAKYGCDIDCDGTSRYWTVVHELDSTDVAVAVWNRQTRGKVEAAVAVLGPDVVGIGFDQIPAVGKQYRVVVIA